MSKERKFHELIEQQNKERKARITARVMEEIEHVEQVPAPVENAVKPQKPFPWRRFFAVAASVVVVAAAGIVVWQVLPPNNSDMMSGSSQSSSSSSFDSSSSSSGNSSGDRYCTVDDYDVVDTPLTLKEYAIQTETALLYFDWYAETDYDDFVYQLNETNEIICFKEIIVDLNGCVVNLYVTSTNIEIEELSPFKNLEESSALAGAMIHWENGLTDALATFEYEGYNYYIKLVEPMDDDHILNLVTELLS